VSGWITDFILFWWALLYWNARKTWFRLQGAHRDSCPCQVYSDSGHALDSRCQAVANWRNPVRFRRVCPLLTETKDGWRCGVDAERVRPFWGRAAIYGAAGFALLYAAGTLGVYGFLRAARYDITYATVAWPPAWSELRQSQEKLYAARAQQALAAGNYAEAILALQMVCEINPRNYGAAITLASLTQVAGQPSVAEHIFSRLMHEVPEQRPTTAQIWIRALLARADYEQIKPLATAMLTEDAGRREAWMHALLFAAHQTRDEAALQAVVRQDSGLPDWCADIARTEILLLQGRTDDALPALVRVHSRPGSPYLPYFQVQTLMSLGRHDQAGELINAYGTRLPVEEAAFLRLRLFAAKDWTSLMGPEYDNLLSYPMTPRLAAQFCAWFIESPDAAAYARFADRFEASGPPLDSDSLPLYHASYLAAVVSGDAARADRLAAAITRFTSADARALRAIGELLVHGAGRPQLTQLLPLAPLPVEVSYAILDRTPRANQP
jgi:tetratricopeptide (TPR) repeat protein